MTSHPFDVVILSSVDWDAARQRHHAFAEGWARAGHRVFFVENTGSREPGLRDLARVARRLGRILGGGRRSGRARAPAGVRVYNPLVLPPTRGLFRKANSALFAPRVARMLREDGLGADPVVFAYLPTATTLSLLDGLQPSLAVYDCVDNFHGLPSAPKDLAKTEAALLSRCGLVLTTSRTLYEEKRRLHPNVLELHHGTSEAFFLPPRPPGPHRRLAYFGTLWRALDYGPVAALAQAGFEVELIGPVKEAPPPLPSSVRMTGMLPHSELPARLAGADALLLPYADDEYNRGVIPAKTYECLATGRPVLASPLPALKAVPELSEALLFAKTPEEWVRNARSLDSREDAASRSRRLALARANSEEKSFDRLRRAVDAALSPPLRGKAGVRSKEL